MLKLFVATIVVAAVAANIESQWAVFKETHKKTYTTEMDQIRKFIWKTNMEKIEAHNEKFLKGLTTYYMGENEFTDLTHEEFVGRMNGMKIEATPQLDKSPKFNASLPDTVDWRPKGYVTKVKNQGQCGSCWSFSATGSLEGQHFKSTGKLVSLSESNLMDCSGKYGNHGCEGGLMDQAFQYIIKNKGIDTEESYPYEPKDRRCEFDRSNVGATMSSFQDIKSGSESELQEKVATIGPISVAIDASHASFQSYQGGVYDEPRCSSSKLDHGVLAVGYGVHESKDYWLVKNSWGESWGMDGYIMMSRNKDNQCGIATQSSYPIV